MMLKGLVDKFDQAVLGREEMVSHQLLCSDSVPRFDCLQYLSVFSHPCRHLPGTEQAL